MLETQAASSTIHKATGQGNRLSLRQMLYISIFGPSASVAILLSRWIFVHSADKDFFLNITNYIVVFIPFVLSIFFAFVPDMRGRHIALRIGVIAVGLAFSVILYTQQRLAAEAAIRDQNELVTRAVQKSNEHSDGQIASVKSEIQTTNRKLDGISPTIAHEIETNTTMLTQALVKVNPYALSRARLQFSLFVKDVDQFPLTEYYFPREDDRSVNVEFFVRNVSTDTSTGKGDLWTQICSSCSYPKDPPGFAKREGADEHVRHRMFEFLNAGITLERMVLPVRPPNGVSTFQVSFRYSCESCGGLTDWQTMTIHTGEDLFRAPLTAPKKPKKLKN